MELANPCRCCISCIQNRIHTPLGGQTGGTKNLHYLPPWWNHTNYFFYKYTVEIIIASFNKLNIKIASLNHHFEPWRHRVSPPLQAFMCRGQAGRPTTPGPAPVGNHWAPPPWAITGPTPVWLSLCPPSWAITVPRPYVAATVPRPPGHCCAPPLCGHHCALPPSAFTVPNPWAITVPPPKPSLCPAPLGPSLCPAPVGHHCAPTLGPSLCPAPPITVPRPGGPSL